MSTKTLGQVLSLRELRAERAQIALTKAVEERKLAAEKVTQSLKELNTYIEQRPDFEHAVFEKFRESDCDSDAIEVYRHGMRNCEAEEARLQVQHSEHMENERVSEEQVASAMVVLNNIKRKVEKLNILQDNLIAIEKYEKQRSEDEELDEWSTLAGAS